MSEQSENVDEAVGESAGGGAVDGGNPPVDAPPAGDDGATVDEPGTAGLGVAGQGRAGQGEGGDSGGDEPPEFPRSYVERLRKEAAGYRDRAKGADDLARRLHVELVRGTGRLADPTDLTFDAAHLDSPDALTAAIDALVERKPHLAARRPAGDIGQGATGGTSVVDLAGLLRGAAG